MPHGQFLIVNIICVIVNIICVIVNICNLGSTRFGAKKNRWNNPYSQRDSKACPSS